jgi:hypothetical protein
VIYSSDALTPEAKRNLSSMSSERVFDLSALGLMADSPETVVNVVAAVQSLRQIKDSKA